MHFCQPQTIPILALYENSANLSLQSVLQVPTTVIKIRKQHLNLPLIYLPHCVPPISGLGYLIDRLAEN